MLPNSMNFNICFVIFAIMLHTVNSQKKLLFRIVEECPLKTNLGNIHAMIYPHNSEEPSKYSYKAVTNIEPFYIDPMSHNLIVSKRVDRESICRNKRNTNNDFLPNCQMQFKIIQMPTKSDSSFAPHIYKVLIEILDINDNPPRWPNPKVHFNLAEHSNRNTKLALPLAFDPDQPPINTTQRYKISHQTIVNGFRLHPTHISKLEPNLWLIVNKDFDREVEESITVRIEAYDGGEQPLTGYLEINISLTDINDQTPKFINRNYRKTITENLPLRTKIIQLKAVDDDKSDQNRLNYQFDNSADENVKNRFYINPNSGEIFTSGYIDYETKSKYDIPVIVTDGKHVDRTSIQIFVKNINDNAPEITVMYVSGSQYKTHPHSTQYRVTIPENQNPEAVLVSFSVSDKDDITTNKIKCSIRSKGDYLKLKPFSKDSNDHFYIVTTKMFDRELISQYYAELFCSDKDEERPRTSSITFEIFITDKNDNAPIFIVPPQVDTITPIYQIKENLPIGTIIKRLKATDKDIGQNANIEYSLDSMSQKYFSIDPLSGEISSNKIFDFETMEKFELTVNASNPIVKNQNQVLLYTLKKILIKIIDVNDCEPVFTQDHYVFNIKEGNTKNMVVGEVVVTDKDKSERFKKNYFEILPNSQGFYTPSEPNPKDYFRISDSGFIYVKVAEIDREKVNTFSFKVRAKDRSKEPLSSTALVKINIDDINDNEPQFKFPSDTSYTLNVSYQESVGHCIAQLEAKDDDFGENSKIEYNIITPVTPKDESDTVINDKDQDFTRSPLKKVNKFGLFQIEKSSGKVYISQKMTIKDVGTKIVWFEARDKGQPPRQTFSRLFIHIVNSNKIDNQYSSKNQNHKSFGFNKNGFENDLMIMIVLVAIVILVAMVMVIIILMLRCRNASRSHALNSGSTSGGTFLSKSYLERRPDGHSCSPINELCHPYPTNGPKRSHTISTYLGGHCGGSSQMLDFASGGGYLTNPNSRNQLHMSSSSTTDQLEPVCQSMNRLHTNGGSGLMSNTGTMATHGNRLVNNPNNNNTFSKKYYTSSALYRPNTLWSNEGSPELSRRLCQRLNNDPAYTPALTHQQQQEALIPSYTTLLHSSVSPTQSDPNIDTTSNTRFPPNSLSVNTNLDNTMPAATTKKSITLPNFLSAIEECDDQNGFPTQLNTDSGSDLNPATSSTFKKAQDSALQPQHRLSVTWIDKIDSQQIDNNTLRRDNLNKSIDSCLNQTDSVHHNNNVNLPFIQKDNHEYTQLRMMPQNLDNNNNNNNLPSTSNSNSNNHENVNDSIMCNSSEYPVTYV